MSSKMSPMLVSSNLPSRLGRRVLASSAVAGQRLAKEASSNLCRGCSWRVLQQHMIGETGELSYGLCKHYLSTPLTRGEYAYIQRVNIIYRNI